MAYTINLNELSHSGVLGMKWGVRKQHKSVALEAQKGVRQASNLYGTIQREKNRRTKKMDLSEMSDKEMREKINRELLERQYDDMFNPKKVKRGKSKVKTLIDVAGPVVGVVGSSLGIALAIKELKQK